jgi:hypothetical protein
MRLHRHPHPPASWESTAKKNRRLREAEGALGIYTRCLNRSGWQQMNFATPVTSGPLTALADGADGGNGVFMYGSTGSFPNQTFNSSNYWVDVLWVSGQ